MTRVVRFHRLGGPEVLCIETADPPGPGPDEVRIRVKALGLNRAEALLRRGTYIEAPTLPSGLGLEAAGVVEALGAGVAGLAVGDAVSVVPPLSMTRWPAYGELATFPAELVVRHPPWLAWEEAAATWMAAVTAYGALVDLARIGPGDRVIVTAASSSVGLAAIQIANMLGATPIAVTRSGAKAAALLGAGAAEVVASADGGFAARLLAAAGPDGARVALDAVGGPLLEPLAAATSRGGILIEYGGLGDGPTPFPLFAALSRSLTLRGYLVHEVVRDPGRLSAAKAFVLDGLRSGALRPIIDSVFPFDSIVEAHRRLESNEQFGKIVVTL